ncbi:DEAD/DEAH box helicase [Marinobacter hydrocarbonoclasticus]|nr:DEAD/DEAH box helicase [Marinobacter nauticus]
MTTNALNLLPDTLQRHLASLRLVPLTQTQSDSLPAILAGDDLRVQAPTGSGKTAAFALALLSRLDLSRRVPQGLVLAPSRELAEQTAQTLRELGRPYPNLHVAAVYGGTDPLSQARALAHGAHLVVGTPGRLCALLKDGTLKLAQVRTLVLDEADRLHCEGFIPDLTTLTDALPNDVQRLWFSATYPAPLLALAPEQSIVIAAQQPRVRQQALTLPDAPLETVLPGLTGTGRTLVFVNTKAQCRALAQGLVRQRCPALALHGDLNQQQREQTLVRFRHGSARVLVATDLAARGLDVSDIERVINAELAPDADTHLQRIGRTARAGSEGRAITLYRPEQADVLKARVGEISTSADWPQPVKAQLAPCATLMVDAGRRARLRKGDLMGALIKGAGIPADAIVAIDLYNDCSYLTLSKAHIPTALKALDGGQVKNRTVRARLLI